MSAGSTPSRAGRILWQVLTTAPLCWFVHDKLVGIDAPQLNTAAMDGLQPGDIILTQRPATYPTPRVGDVLVFRSPFDATKKGVARVVGDATAETEEAAGAVEDWMAPDDFAHGLQSIHRSLHLNEVEKYFVMTDVRHPRTDSALSSVADSMSFGPVRI